MNRAKKILLSALNAHDNDTVKRLQIPKYESTKGTYPHERDALLINRNVFFSESHSTVTVVSNRSITPTASIQINKISSSEKLDHTRIQSNVARRVVFSDATPGCSKIDEISSTAKESDSSEDNNSDEDYIPDSDDNASQSDGSNSAEIEHPDSDEVPIQKNITITYSTDDMHQPQSEDSEYQSAPKANKLAVSSSRKKRVWNKRDHCLYCYNDVTKISRHLLRHHQNEMKVQEILALRIGDKRRKYLFNKLRNEGNFIKSSVDETIIPIRKPVGESLGELSHETYLPCKHCKGFYKRKALYRHVKNCIHNEEKNPGRISAQADGQSLLSSYRSNDLLKKEIFPKMRADNVSFTAKTDKLICAVAARYLKSHGNKQYHLVASRKMRQLASLLIEIRKKLKVRSLLEALDPVHFDTIVACTKTISRFDPKTETYGAPSLASNMGTQLKECIDVAFNILVKENPLETVGKKKLKSLKDLISTEWQYEVSTIANQDLSQKKWNKPSLIPLAEDLTLLRSYLLSEGQKCRNVLEVNSNDEKAFKALQEICYIQLLLLNRRRVGELQRLTVHSYTENINNSKSSEFDNCISQSEKVLMRSFKRIVIKGKRGRGVPVLFTDEMIKNTEMLLKNRTQFVPENNMYLFANTKSSCCINGTKAMYKHVRLAGVKNAAALTSTKLRKHLATMSQVINLSEQDLEQLAIFMGHTSEIHKTYYRLPNDVYQMAKVSKLLLLNERGEASKFKGKRLDEIDITLDTIDEDQSEDENDDGILNCDSADNEHVIEENTPLGKIVQKTKRVLEPWTETQKKKVFSHFKNHLQKKIPPKKNECVLLKEQNPDLLSNKSWEKIKIFIVNTYNKK